MKGFSNMSRALRGPAALAAAGLLLACLPAQAQEGAVTARSLVDRAEIQDLLTRYYYNFGHGEAEGFASFYTDDAELVLGPKSYKGKEGIQSAYSSVPKDAPQRKALSFSVTMTNPLIVVHGDTATAQLIFTEFVVDTQGAAPRVLTQGHEYDNLVKVKGQWRIARRQIVAGAQPPAGWTG